MRRLLIAVLALAAAACRSDGLVSPVDFQAWSSAKARWKAAGIQHYRYESTVSCFCTPEYGQPITVEYLGDLLVDARYANGSRVPDIYAKSRPPIDTLFATIVMPASDWLERVDVTYDKTLGYPKMINFSSKPNIADGGSTRTITKFEVLNTCPQCDVSLSPARAPSLNSPIHP